MLLVLTLRQKYISTIFIHIYYCKPYKYVYVCLYLDLWYVYVISEISLTFRFLLPRGDSLTNSGKNNFHTYIGSDSKD